MSSSSDEDSAPDEALPPWRTLWRDTDEYLEHRSQQASSDLMPWSAPESGAVKKYLDKLLNVRALYYLEAQEMFELEIKAGLQLKDVLSFEAQNAVRQADEQDELKRYLDDSQDQAVRLCAVFAALTDAHRPAAGRLGLASARTVGAPTSCGRSLWRCLRWRGICRRWVSSHLHSALQLPL